MAYHNTFAWQQKPTMLGAPALKGRTMITAIPSRGYSRVWEFEGDRKDTRGQFEFALVPKLGGGSSSYSDGSLVVSNVEYKSSFQHGDMDIFERLF